MQFTKFLRPNGKRNEPTSDRSVTFLIKARLIPGATSAAKARPRPLRRLLLRSTPNPTPRISARWIYRQATI